MAVLEIAFVALIILPFVLWILWCWFSYRMGYRKFLFFQLAILVVALFFVTWKLELFPGSTGYYHRMHNKELTGLSFSAEKELYSFYKYDDFFGDGYSITVWELDDETAEYFRHPDSAFFKMYPLSPDYRNKWQSRHWAKSPIDDNEQIFLTHALFEYNTGNKSETNRLNGFIRYAKTVLKQKGAFYAYHYNMQGKSSVGDIDFYIISVNDKRIIKINHNT